MKLLKSFIVVFSLALSLGSFSVAVFAIDPVPPPPASEGIKQVLDHVADAIKALDAGESKGAIREHIMIALRISKEIHGTELLDVNRLKANRVLKKARTAAKKDDKEKTKELLNDVVARFKGLKKYI